MMTCPLMYVISASWTGPVRVIACRAEFISITRPHISLRLSSNRFGVDFAVLTLVCSSLVIPGMP
eukprot:scaffold3065_cov389-Prasinococcus_capsulatus_cf.AAC.15